MRSMAPRSPWAATHRATSSTTTAPTTHGSAPAPQAFVLQTGGAGANPSWVNSATTTQTLQNKDLTNVNNTLPAEIVVAASDENYRADYRDTESHLPDALCHDGNFSACVPDHRPIGGSLLTVDVNDSGTTILSTKLTFDNGEKTTTTAATPAVISDSALADDAEITVDIDTVGTSGASGLKVTLIGNQMITFLIAQIIINSYSFGTAAACRAGCRIHPPGRRTSFLMQQDGLSKIQKEFTATSAETSCKQDSSSFLMQQDATSKVQQQQ